MAKASNKPVKEKTIVTEPFYKNHLSQLLLIVFSLVLFSNSLFNGYNLDDELVSRNHRLTSKGISAISEIFTSPYYQDEMGYAYEYRPVVLTTFAIEHTLFGEHPFISHLINLLIYCVLCLSIHRYLLTIGGEVSPLLALLVSLAFCVHPSHTEVVCSIKNRDEILGLLFCVLSAYLTLRAARTENWIKLFLAAILYLAAILCKSTFVPFALIIPLSVILFSDCSLLFTIALTGVLSLESYFILDVNPAHYKLWFVLLLVVAVLILYFVFRGIPLKSVLSSWMFKKAEVNVSNSVFSGVRIWVSSFNITSFYGIIPVVVIVLAYKWLPSHSLWVFVLVASVVVITFLLQQKKYRYWSLRMALAGCSFIFLEQIMRSTSDYISQKMMLELLFIITAALFFWGKSFERLAGLVLLTLFPWPEIAQQYGKLIDIFLIFLFSRLAIGKKVLIPVLVLQIVWFVYNLAGSSGLTLLQSIYHPLIQVVLIGFLFFAARKHNSFSQVTYWMAGVFMLVLTGIFIGQYRADATQRLTSDKDYLNVVETLVKKPVDRPLQYIEFPLPPGTSNDLKMGTSLVVLGHYLQKAFMPYPLSFYYGYDFIKPTGIRNATPLIVLTLYLLLALFTVYFLRTNRFIAFGLVIYLVSAVMVSGYFISVPGIVADRYLLIPTLGFSMAAMAIVFLLFKVSREKNNFSQLPGVLKGVLLIVWVLYSGLTFSRNFQWKDDLTLMRKDIRYVTGSAQAHNLLGLHLMQHVQLEPNMVQQNQLIQEAVTHFKQALSIYPPFFNAAFDLGRAYSALNMSDSALVYFIKASQLDTSFLPSYRFAAEILIGRKEYDRAIPYAEYFIKHSPQEYDGYAKLSYIYFSQAKYIRSIEVNRLAMQQIPNSLNPLINIAQTYRFMNQPDSALQYYRRAHILAPDNSMINQTIILMESQN